MNGVLRSACLVALIAFTQAVIPSGYIMQLTPVCGADESAPAKIKIVTDLNLEAKAMCEGADVDFVTTDDVNFELDLVYPENSGSCVFMKRRDARVYFVTVQIAYGEVDSLVHQYEEEYTVTCTFDLKGDDGSVDRTLLDGLIAPTEKATNVGSDATGTFELSLIDVLGDKLAGSNVAMGRTIQLQGSSTGEDSELGIRPVSCWAKHQSEKYAILRAGCGDGIVFKKDAGFTTAANVTTSPYFKAFNINNGVSVQFECTFVICASNCDGSSCLKEVTGGD